MKNIKAAMIRPNYFFLEKMVFMKKPDYIYTYENGKLQVLLTEENLDFLSPKGFIIY